MAALVGLIAVISLPVCLLLGWINYLRLARHVHDRSGADAIRYLPALAIAFWGACFRWFRRHSR